MTTKACLAPLAKEPCSRVFDFYLSTVRRMFPLGMSLRSCHVRHLERWLSRAELNLLTRFARSSSSCKNGLCLGDRLACLGSKSFKRPLCSAAPHTVSRQLDALP